MSKRSSHLPLSAPGLRPTVLAASVHLTLAGILLTGWQPVAHAQTAAADARSYDIPAGSLGTVLKRFATESGVLLAATPELVQGRQSPGVRGSYSAQAALAALLAGTGLAAEGNAQGGYRLRVVEPGTAKPAAAAAGVATGEAATLPSVTVKAEAERADGRLPDYAGGQIARGSRVGMLGSKDFMDTPFSITSYTSQTAANLQATTVADVLANDPSIGLETNKMGWLGNFNIRGFTVQSNDTSINGIGGLHPQNLQIPIEFVERVDVLRGPTALLSGMSLGGAVGGLINIETKRAAVEPLTRVGVGYTSDSIFGTHVDLGRRFGQDKEWGIRVNGAADGGDTAIDGMSSHRRFGSIGLDYAGQRFRFSLDAYALDQKFRGGSYLAAQLSRSGTVVTSVPRAPDASTQVFDGQWSDSKANMVLAQAEYDLNERWTVRAGAGHSVGKSLGGSTGNLLTNVDGSGNYTGTFWTSPSIRKSTVYFAGLNGRFSTGPVSHQLAMNVQHTAVDGFYKGASSASWTGSLYNPTRPPVALPVIDGALPKNLETRLNGIAIADTLGFFDDRLLVTLGVRRQNVESKNINGVTGAVTPYDASATSPMAAVVGRINGNWSVYANYAEGLSQGITVAQVGAANLGETFPPYKSKQYEAGVKWDGGAFASTLSLFQLAKPSTVLDSSTRPLPTVRLNGEQRNRGIEWQFFGQPFERVRLTGGVVYTQGILTRTQGGLTDGNTATGVPKWRATLGAEYDVPGLNGLTLSGRWTHASSQYADEANTLKVDAWNRFDLGARYGTKIGGQKVNFYANVENVANKSYWEAASPRSLVINSPRTFRLSAVMDF